jgi:transposase
MSAVVAVRRNPILKEFYERLRAKGKPAKQALTACIRKLLVILNAMLTSGRIVMQVLAFKLPACSRVTG